MSLYQFLYAPQHQMSSTSCALPAGLLSLLGVKPTSAAAASESSAPAAATTIAAPLSFGAPAAATAEAASAQAASSAAASGPAVVTSGWGSDFLEVRGLGLRSEGSEEMVGGNVWVGLRGDEKLGGDAQKGDIAWLRRACTASSTCRRACLLDCWQAPYNSSNINWPSPHARVGPHYWECKALDEHSPDASLSVPAACAALLCLCTEEQGCRCQGHGSRCEGGRGGGWRQCWPCTRCCTFLLCSPRCCGRLGSCLRAHCYPCRPEPELRGHPCSGTEQHGSCIQLWRGPGRSGRPRCGAHLPGLQLWCGPGLRSCPQCSGSQRCCGSTAVELWSASCSPSGGPGQCTCVCLACPRRRPGVGACPCCSCCCSCVWRVWWHISQRSSAQQLPVWCCLCAQLWCCFPACCHVCPRLCLWGRLCRRY